MGCSFSKVKPRNPTKTETKLCRITPETMRKLAVQEKRENENREDLNRRSLINYDFQNNVEYRASFKHNKAEKKEPNMNQEVENVVVKRRKKIKKSIIDFEDQEQQSKFLSKPISKRNIEVPSVNKKALYFKALPKEIKELRYQSLKVQEMEEIKRFTGKGTLKSFRRSKIQNSNFRKKSFFSRYSQRTIKDLDGNPLNKETKERMDSIEEILDERDNNKKKGKLGVMKKKPKLVFPRTRTTYKKPSGLTESQIITRFIGKVTFKDLKLQKIQCGLSKSLEPRKRGLDYVVEQFTLSEKEKKEKEKKETDKARELGKELKTWCVEFTLKQKKLLEEKKLQVIQESQLVSFQNKGKELKELKEEVLESEDSYLDDEFKDAFGFNESMKSSNSSSLLIDDMEEREKKKKDKNSIYDTVFGLKGF